MILYLIITGFISLLGQVVLLRELNVASYGIELIYILAIGVWLFATAAGVIMGQRIKQSFNDIVMLLLVIFCIALPADVVFIRGSRLLFAGVPGAFISFPLQMATLVIAMASLGFLSGLLFFKAAQGYVVKGKKTLAEAYAVESMGSFAGGLLASIFLKWGIQNFQIAIICSLIAIISAISHRTNRKNTLRNYIAIPVAIFLLMLLSQSTLLDHKMTAWNHPGLLETKDSPYGRITVTKFSGQIAVFENDALAFETEGTDAEFFVHLSMLQHPQPERVLILGGGIEGLVKETLQYRPIQIDNIEINHLFMEIVISHLPIDLQKSMIKKNVKLITAEPRQFLQDSGRYDMILVAMPEPLSGQANRFYTREFFAQCAAKLNLHGILSFRIRSAENYWTPQLTSRTASIYKALAEVYPDIMILPGTTNVITASYDPLPRSPDLLIERLKNRKIVTRLISPQYIRYLYRNDRFVEIPKLLQSSAVPINSDTKPICYYYALQLWLSKFFPVISSIDLTLFTDINPKILFMQGLVLICIALLFLICRFRPSCRPILFVATGGFIGMVLETVLLLHYQMKQGILYQDIGLLTTLFMGGIAIGSWITKILFFSEKIRMRIIRPRWIGAGLIASLGLLCLLMRSLIMENFKGLLPTAVFMSTIGLLVAGIFAYASLHKIDNQEKVISPLYAADLLGGCFASLLGSLIMIPLLGLDATTQWVTVLAILSLLIV